MLQRNEYSVLRRGQDDQAQTVETAQPPIFIGDDQAMLYRSLWESLPDCPDCDGTGLVDCGPTARACACCDNGKLVPDPEPDYEIGGEA
jgi:hypothetical protein